MVLESAFESREREAWQSKERIGDSRKRLFKFTLPPMEVNAFQIEPKI